MKSKIFDHPTLRILLGVLLVWSFLTIFLVVGSGSGCIWNLVTIGVRSSWRAAQIIAWLGTGAEVAASLAIHTLLWRKIATVSMSSLVLSAIWFVMRSDDLRYLQYRVIGLPIVIFVACGAMRIAQLRMKPRAEMKPFGQPSNQSAVAPLRALGE